MPEKVTSLNGLKVTLEYGSHNVGAHNVYYVKWDLSDAKRFSGRRYYFRVPEHKASPLS
ncbi:TPA: hypothetical protein LUK53_004128 [Escherichia coli]|nr:hypothetical protein [Escherichia coli]